MNYNELIHKTDSGKVKNIYLFHGKENFLIEEAIKYIVNKAIGSSKNSFNIEKAYAKDINPGKILNMAQTLPLIGKKRVVIIKNIHELKDINEKRLLAYLQSPSPSTCLIFTSEKINKKKFYSLINNCGDVVEFRPLYSNQIVPWISHHVKKFAVNITREAAAHITYCLGNNLQLIDNELKKIITYIGDNKKITLTDVKNVICGIDIKVETIFNLTDAIGEKNIKNCLECLNRLIRQGEPELMILSMITRQFRQIFLLKAMQGNNYTDRELIAKTKISPFLLKKINIQTKKFSIDELEDCFYKILDTDIKIKTAGQNTKLIIESLLFDITGCGTSGQTAAIMPLH